MMRSLWTAASGMTAQQSNLDVVSNNLANVNTTGFKKSRSDFQDLMYQTIRQAGTTTGPDNQLPTGVQIGHGTRLVATQKIYTQGSFQSTGNSYDIAIEGDGFFQIAMPDGTIAYTRDGSFKKDENGRLVTSEGYALDPEIAVPEEALDLTISAEGVVSVSLPGQDPEEIGQIELARFINPAGLENIGRNLVRETAASGAPVVVNPGTDGAGTLVQKYLEMSNVQVVEEMVNMIVAQRAYETNSKAITTSDDMLSQANNLKR
ncbi:flagellar basal-body rod protein FlgG|uniref:Flagellar basal-body rod protein FlgG n=1 Tax=Dendrosporobacter quercicolus TaxID=146817 RepID=A0A1G9R2W6_9FIRM|nr:flagellar basal-body rod protein FlgG [Dendrosporobacter quercicolus]NSL48460.1 flagellar basal-body rod protein FlgG [Dendrosporobacter quercicolus DSM 1736]SDM17626.1 flagellar basal-body rod protein FlgG [Dendrosporobacter quercicolus]